MPIRIARVLAQSMDDDDEREEVEAFRAQMLRQMLGGAEPQTEPNAVDSLLGRTDGATPAEPAGPPVVQVSTLAPGQILVANPERFCSRNPFARPVRDLGRFGLQGPIDDNDLSPDMKAQMLPVRASRCVVCLVPSSPSETGRSAELRGAWHACRCCCWSSTAMAARAPC